MGRPSLSRTGRAITAVSGTHETPPLRDRRDGVSVKLTRSPGKAPGTGGLPQFFGGTGLPPGSTAGGGKRSLRICSARMAA